MRARARASRRRPRTPTHRFSKASRARSASARVSSVIILLRTADQSICTDAAAAEKPRVEAEAAAATERRIRIAAMVRVFATRFLRKEEDERLMK